MNSLNLNPFRATTSTLQNCSSCRLLLLITIANHSSLRWRSSAITASMKVPGVVRSAPRSGRRVDKVCPHAKLFQNCPDCRPSGRFVYRRCEEVQCEHCKPLWWCSDCGGGGVCKHKKRKNSCLTCCPVHLHCRHDIKMSLCLQCGGFGLCVHQKEPKNCTTCREPFCEHHRRWSTCRLCGGKNVCSHGKLKWKCKDCCTGSWKNRKKKYGQLLRDKEHQKRRHVLKYEKSKQPKTIRYDYVPLDPEKVLMAKQLVRDHFEQKMIELNRYQHPRRWKKKVTEDAGLDGAFSPLTVFVYASLLRSSPAGTATFSPNKSLKEFGGWIFELTAANNQVRWLQINSVSPDLSQVSAVLWLKEPNPSQLLLHKGDPKEQKNPLKLKEHEGSSPMKSITSESFSALSFNIRRFQQLSPKES